MKLYAEKIQCPFLPFVPTATILLNQILVASQYHCDIICGDEEGGRPSSTVCASDGVTYGNTHIFFFFFLLFVCLFIHSIFIILKSVH